MKIYLKKMLTIYVLFSHCGAIIFLSHKLSVCGNRIFNNVNLLNRISAAFNKLVPGKAPAQTLY